MRSPRFRLFYLWIAVLIAACNPSTGSSASSTAALESPPGASPPAKPRLPSFAADEPLIEFGQKTDAGGGIFVQRPGETTMQQLATDVLPGVHKGGDWSPDGQRVAFMDEITERMWIAHLDGTPSESVPACDTRGCDYPAWSPDGRRIAFSRVESGPAVGPAAVGIYVVDLATGEVSQVVRLQRPLLADAPRWSPDGLKIVFQLERMDAEAYDTGAAIAVIPVAGGEPRYLTDFDVFGTTPDWGWVTNEIVFSTRLIETKRAPAPGDETWDLYAVQPDGTGLRTITNVADGQRLIAPRWTPDGTHLTAYDLVAGGGILVDPVSGTFEPFVTTGNYTRPLVRPLPRAG
jgi:Tol biopolymer transport system component